MRPLTPEGGKMTQNLTKDGFIMKRIVTIGTIFFLFLLGFIGYKVFFERTPEKILKLQFEISLPKNSYSVSEFHEQWDLNGDGYCLIRFKLTERSDKLLESSMSKKMKQLPVIDQDFQMSDIPENFKYCKNGFFVIEKEKNDSRNFKILLIDTKENVALLYYQIM
jgi:hypothetical protein